MLSKKMEKALNAQFNFEIYSGYIYAAMSSWFKSKNLNGLANWMNVQFREEFDHASMFYGYMHDCGAEVLYEAIPKPKSSWRDPGDVFKDALAHERKVTSNINKIVDLAIEEHDHATNARMQWFVSEQVEEEANALGVIQQIDLAKGSPDALMLLDRELGQRLYTPVGQGA